MSPSSPISSNFGCPSPDFNFNSPLYHDDGEDYDDDEWLYWRDHMDSMPRLPTDRSRPLTPSGFRESDDQDQNRPVAAHQTSSWFKLPAPLRHDILRLAFGAKKLHMCLSFDDAERGIADESEKPLERNGWEWYGCICNRQEDKSLGPMTRGGLNIGPWEDHCCMPSRLLSIFTHKPENIGIMGWLRSCRQNYAETIDILYRYNTIILSGDATIENLNKLIIRPRLETITSLEVKCSMNSYNLIVRLPGETFFDHHGHFNMVLELVRHNMTNINRLYISMEPKISMNVEAYDINTDIEAFDKLIREMPQIKECSFALPDLLFNKDRISASIRDDYDKPCSYRQVWRQLGDSGTWKPGKDNIWNYVRDGTVRGSFTGIELPWVDSYPKPPYHLGENPGLGYWILEACDMEFYSETDYGSEDSFEALYTDPDDWLRDLYESR